MKKNLFFILSLLTLSVNNIFGQNKSTVNTDNPLNVKHYKLENGLNIYLNEDHNKPSVFGAVVVKGGSKRDPKDATGIAHYFEHIMFKGTDQLGTTDYGHEKIYLDSIRNKYDELAKTTDKKERETIQMKINDLSVKASEYAIPNELDKMISKIGGTGLNAYTTEDNIVYHNFFPSHQIEKWLEIYSHRFVNPVFRLFQSELEAVYEEKNMSMDDPFNKLYETFMKAFYKKHPYGQQTTLGSVEHLKNPSLSKMLEYFNTYYVANNMALILSGDFNTEEVMPMIKEKFGKWRTGTVSPMPDYAEESFKGREFIQKRLTPIRVGIMGYRTILKGHPDEAALDLCNNILSNQAQTGLLDKLYMDNKLMGAYMTLEQQIDYGATIVLFVPKIVGQSLQSVEKLVVNEIEKVKKGTFSDSLLNAVKVNFKKQQLENIEDMERRSEEIIDAFMENKEWSEVMSYAEKLDKITKQDVINVANKYYGNNYLVVYSKMGFPKKHKLKKPSFKPIPSKNTDQKSLFAKAIENIKEHPMTPRFIEFNKDVRFEDIKNNVHFYYTPNPINTIFSLELQFGVGTHKIPVLAQAANFLSLIGTQKHAFEEFSKSLQSIGSSFSASASKDYFTISVDGLDEHFTETLLLINELLTQMKTDDKQLEKLIQEAKMNRKVENKDPWTEGRALMEYALYKNKSSYLNRLSVKEIKKLTGDTLLQAIKEALKYEMEIHYCGKLAVDTVKSTLLKNFIFPDNLIKTESPIILEREKYSTPTVFFLNDKKAIQSQVYFNVEGEKNDEHDRTMSSAFNTYFGADMYSIVFQEIRELRSLAYSAYSYYNTPFYINKNNGYLYGNISTQADKTNEAITVFSDLLKNMPQKPERMETIKLLLTQSINSNYPPFRNTALWVSYWRKQGYNDDPRKKRMEEYKVMNFDDIVSFYKKNIAGKNMTITIAGDKSRIDMNKLSESGKITEVTKKNIFK